MSKSFRQLHLKSNNKHKKKYFISNKIDSNLKINKYFALNIHGDKIIEDSLRYAERAGFSLQETYKMRLSKICGKGHDKTTNKFKQEPIFIFKK
jgi:hypothetical protein